jgi:MYXO-CTERM domain-containing protein
VTLRAGGGDSGEAPDTDLSDEGEGGDDGAPDTAAAPGSDSPDAPGEKGGCGCASGGGSASLGPLLALALLARRRRPTCAG